MRYPCSSHPAKSILRPMISATLSYKGQSPIDMSMLVDSGADFSTISIGVARSLGIDVSSLKRDKTDGVGGTTDVAWTEIDISFGQRGHNFNYRIPFQIILKEGNEGIPLIGREPIFLKFDVNFRMSFAEPKGKFVLTEVTKTRDPSKYRHSNKTR